MSSNAESSRLSIGIGPVYVPEYLNRPQIVTRTGMQEIDIAKFDRWGDSLGTSVSSVIADNVSALLSTDRVFEYPWKGNNALDYQVVVDIRRFDGSIPGNVELLARWTLLKDGKETRKGIQKFYGKKPIAGQGYPGLVSTMSLVLYDLSKEIAGAVALAQAGDNSH